MVFRGARRLGGVLGSRDRTRHQAAERSAVNCGWVGRLGSRQERRTSRRDVNLWSSDDHQMTQRVRRPPRGWLLSSPTQPQSDPAAPAPHILRHLACERGPSVAHASAAPCAPGFGPARTSVACLPRHAGRSRQATGPSHRPVQLRQLACRRGPSGVLGGAPRALGRAADCVHVRVGERVMAPIRRRRRVYGQTAGEGRLASEACTCPSACSPACVSAPAPTGSTSSCRTTPGWPTCSPRWPARRSASCARASASSP